MEYKFRMNGEAFEAAVEEHENNKLDITLNGKHYEIELENNRPKPRIAADATAALAAQSIAAQNTMRNVVPSKTPKAKSVKSPLPGVVLDIKVKQGDAVKRGQTVMVLEAMKMENNIEATYEGVVASISKSKGDAVMEGDVLIVMQ